MIALSTCKDCGQEFPGSARTCPSCQADVGFPNVRDAERPAERAALQTRLHNAVASCTARGCVKILEDFGGAVLASKAVICRSLGVLQNLISTDNALYSSYYKQVRGQIRLPEDNRFDRGRSAIDGTLFPNYHEDICFAALTLNDEGTAAYGPYSIVLKEKMICLRASVFEENAFQFCQIRHRIVLGDVIPAGYRAVWSDRDRLAMAKLHSKIDDKTTAGDYPSILLHRAADPKEDDFVEVHIWGPIHRSAVERVVGPKPTTREDRVILNSVVRKLKEVGATVELR